MRVRPAVLWQRKNRYLNRYADASLPVFTLPGSAETVYITGIRVKQTCSQNFLYYPWHLPVFRLPSSGSSAICQARRSISGIVPAAGSPSPARIGLEGKIDAILEHSRVHTAALPYITSQFMPRKVSDRPKVIPDGCVNLAFLGEYVEPPANPPKSARVTGQQASPLRTGGRARTSVGGSDPGPNHGQPSPVPGTFPPARLNAVGAGRPARPSPLELHRAGQSRTPATRTAATWRGAAAGMPAPSRPRPAASQPGAKPQIRLTEPPEPPEPPDKFGTA